MDENQESQIQGDDNNRPCENVRVLEEDSNNSKAVDEKNRRFLLKLKIPKAESFLHEDNPQPQSQSQPPPPQPRICTICNKVFGSGKALGGHMRMHVQARNKELLQNNIDQKPIKLNAPTTTPHLSNIPTKPLESFSIIEGEPTCYVCGKNFLSKKSLFGHMRSHPGRPWRGVLPPTTDQKINNNCSSSSTLSDDEKLHALLAATATTTSEADATTSKASVDLMVSVLGWKATGKRGRKSTASASDSGLLPGIEQRMQEAVYDLMMLANANPKPDLTCCNSMMQSRNLPSKKLKIDEGGSRIDVKGKGKEPLNLKWKSLLEGEEDSLSDYNCYRKISEDGLVRPNSNESELDSDNDTLEEMTVSKKRKTRKVKLVELEARRDGGDDQSQKQVNNPVAPTRSYICSICNRSFPTHQALGGHRSSHNKMKYVHSRDESVSANDSAAEDYGHYANPTTQMEEVEVEAEAVLGATTHQCTICDKTFPTGQALGGHKRCHWTSPVEIQSSQVTSPGEEAKVQSSQPTSPGEASQTGRRILGFDLNEIPSMEVEEGSVESNYYVDA
ncbi:zinc finger protein azf2 [Fagus crenata]